MASISVDDVRVDDVTFMLHIDSDPHARVALKAYADSVRKDNVRLAEHIDLCLSRVSGGSLAGARTIGRVSTDV